MAFAKRRDRNAEPGGLPLAVALFAPIDQLLASGGDQRLKLSRPSLHSPVRQNMYGCTPHPQAGLLEFSSSTASSISQEAYARVVAARDEFLEAMIAEGTEAAFEGRMQANRAALLTHLGLAGSGTDVVFSASGTDAQIKALFLVKSLSGTPLTTVIAGADQTGSGTLHTARGYHFSDLTAGGQEVQKGVAISGLAGDVRTVGICFHSPDGGFRSPAEMDKAVLAAVAQTVAQDGTVLLQAMDSSKLGWRAPSDACLDEIARRWPGQVQIVVDACQMRLSRARLKALLDRKCIVLITGSKYFTGPAFSGALLVPQSLGAAVIARAPEGLAAYTSRYDWPAHWAVRPCFSARPNWGQWLRWEAALEEMRLYFAVPEDFLLRTQARLAQSVQALIGTSPNLRLLAHGPGETPPTIFTFVPRKDGVPLPPADCELLYRALRRDLRGLMGDSMGICGDAPALAARCQIGQMVALEDGVALRIALSARTIRQCWSADPVLAQQRIAAQEARLSLLVEKLNFLLRHFEALRTIAP